MRKIWRTVPWNVRWQLVAPRNYNGRYGEPVGFSRDGNGRWGFHMANGSFHFVSGLTAAILSLIARVVFRIHVFLRGSF